MSKRNTPSLDHKKRDYSVSEYDPNWKEWYNTLEAQMSSVFADCQPDLYHIGSTAVPGMASKPLIDMLIVVPDIHCLDRHIEDLKRFGYEVHFDIVSQDTILALKQKDNTRIENIHILPQGHAKIDEFLAFVQYFSVSPDEVEEYSNLKLELFAKYPNNYAAYRKEKDRWLGDHYQDYIMPWYQGEG